MGHIRVEELQTFIGESVEISIQDHEGSEQAPSVKKTVKKVEICPDGTHVRVFFDHIYFLAVPLASKVIETLDQWSALDEDSGLTYSIKKVRA